MANIETLNKFYSMLTKVPLRLAHQFQVTVNRTGVTSLQMSGMTVPFSFMASSTDIPSPKMKENTLTYHGIDFVVPSVIGYPHSWSITCLADADLKIRESLEAWMNEYSDISKSGGGKKVIPEWSADIDLFDQTLTKITKSYRFVGIYPTDIGTITLDQKGADNATFTLVLSFQYLYPYKGEGETANQKDPLKSVG